MAELRVACLPLSVFCNPPGPAPSSEGMSVVDAASGRGSASQRARCAAGREATPPLEGAAAAALAHDEASAFLCALSKPHLPMPPSGLACV